MTRRLSPRPGMQQILRNEHLDEHPPPSYRGKPVSNRPAALTTPAPGSQPALSEVEGSPVPGDGDIASIPDPGGSAENAPLT